MELIRKYKQGKLTTADVRRLNNSVICLMVLIAVTSILWSISIHILTSDFHNEIIGAKLLFRPRDFTQLDEKTKEIFYQDLGTLLNETNAIAALNDEQKRENNKISNEMLIMPEQEVVESQTETEKPKVRKIAHLFQTNSKSNDVPETTEPEDDNTTMAPKLKYDAELDRKFLATMTIDVHQTRWQQSAAVQFIYSFPFLSEMISIIWTAMCLIFQSGVKKHWGLPKPWRIVVPSILMFTLMSLGAIIYTLLANKYLRNFCTDLRAELTNPNVLSCGQAISVLRPVIIQHKFSHDVYLNLFRVSYMFTLLLWLLALLIMALRFVFAIDFQLVDVASVFEAKQVESRRPQQEQEFTEVLLSPPHPQQRTQHLQVDERYKSEEDFQSAKSQLSEVAAPLLHAGQRQNVVL